VKDWTDVTKRKNAWI